MIRFLPFGATVARGASVLCVALLLLLPSFVRAAPLNTFPPPIVVIYPFTVSDSTSASESGGNVALLLSNRLDELGGITVKPFTPGTARTAYLTAAVHENADYYVTGFLTPIGSEVSLIIQVVSTSGGTIIWSTTVTVRTYADALGQADSVHKAILAHAERGLASIPVESAPAATAAPDANDAAGVNLTRALGRHHHAPASTPAPAPASTPAPASIPSPVPIPVPSGTDAAKVALAPARPTPTRAAPISGALVTSAAGTADVSLRYYAVNALVAALRHDGVSGGGAVDIAHQDALSHVPDLCRANPASAIVFVPTLTIATTKANDVQLEVSAWSCAGNSWIGTRDAPETTGRRVTTERAIDLAAANAIDAFLKGLK